MHILHSYGVKFPVPDKRKKRLLQVSICVYMYMVYYVSYMNVCTRAYVCIY